MTATLNYDLRNGLEFNTDEMGQANLKMIIDFALETWFDTLRVAALAEEQGLAETNFISIGVLCEMVFEELRKQDEEVAQMWNEGWTYIIKDGSVIEYFLKSWKNIVLLDDVSLNEAERLDEILLCLDMDALRTAYKTWEATK